MSWTRWKAAEKQVAKALGGLRRSRACNWGESCEDVIHERYSIEVKYGKQIPKMFIVKCPTLIVAEDYWYYLCPSKSWTPDDNYYYYCGGFRRKRVKFLEKAFEQAVGYCPTKYPLVCLKPPRYHGFVVVERVPIISPT